MEETDSIQVTVDDIIYNLWIMKQPNYAMRMVATGGRLFVDNTCKKIVIRLE